MSMRLDLIILSALFLIKKFLSNFVCLSKLICTYYLLIIAYSSKLTWKIICLFEILQKLNFNGSKGINTLFVPLSTVLSLFYALVLLKTI